MHGFLVRSYGHTVSELLEITFSGKMKLGFLVWNYVSSGDQSDAAKSYRLLHLIFVSSQFGVHKSTGEFRKAATGDVVS